MAFGIKTGRIECQGVMSERVYYYSRNTLGAKTNASMLDLLVSASVEIYLAVIPSFTYSFSLQ